MGVKNGREDKMLDIFLEDGKQIGVEVDQWRKFKFNCLQEEYLYGSKLICFFKFRDLRMGENRFCRIRG